MLYTPETAHLWPRLIAAAREADTALADALHDLMKRGAHLSLTEQRRLKLVPGTMPETAYREALGTPDRPKYPALKDAMARARTIPHPWIPAIGAAYDLLDDLCREGDAELDAALRAKQTARAEEIAPALLDRHMQAAHVAQALGAAGYWAYMAQASRHVESWMPLYQSVHRAKIPWEPVLAWPVETPDGWFWVTDVEDGPCKPVQLGGKAGTRERQADEPVIAHTHLADVLASLETGRLDPWQREVG